jgi:polyisoprenoid-binding protein YceI
MKPLTSALLSAAAAALIASAAPAAEPINLATGRPQLAPDEIPAGVYNIVTKETLVRYEVLHFGYSDYWGTFAGATGTLTIDPKNLSAAKLEVKIPIYGVETTNRELNGELFSDEFFDGETHPWMRFVSTAVVRTGPRTARVSGNLTMHDITRPADLNVTFIGGGINPFGGKALIIGFRADGVVKRSDFGMGKYVPFVSDETRIVISSSLEQQLP